MKGTTNATQQTLFGEILNLRLVTNLSSHEDLIGVIVKINSLIYIWNGLDITVEIPAMLTYTIEVFEVEGYRTPEVLTIDSQTGNVNNMTLSYDCELVTINVSDSDGNTLSSSNVTINGIVGNKVPYGETYTIVANAIAGYNTPTSLTYTANLPLRTVNMVYLIKSMGVYIEDIDGNLYTEALWDGSKTANGIAVVTDNCEFVMALQDAHTSACQWGSTGETVSGITTTTSNTEAQADYDGEEQTTSILSELGNSSSTSDAPAAYYCRIFTFPNGKNGYLGAAGEWQTALDNKNAIVSALSKCGGTAMKNYYWVSTQYSSYNSWYMDWDNEDLNFNIKYYSNPYVRAFTTLKSDGEESGNDFGIEFPLYLTFDYCERFGLTTSCERAADELGIKLYNCLTDILNEYGEDLYGDGSYIVVSGQILDMLGIEIYVENEKAIEVSKDIYANYIITNGTYENTVVSQSGSITCDYE